MLASRQSGFVLSRLILAADEIVQRLEFADATGDRWPLADGLRRLDCLRLDLRAAAAGDGRAGADACRLAAEATGAITTAVHAHDDGDLGPWRVSRENVLELLSVVRRLCEPQLKAELVGHAAAPAAPAPRRSPAGTMPAAQGDVDPGRKGEKADRPPTGPRGRPPKVADATRAAEAACWRDQAHLEPEIADRCEDDRLDQLFNRMMDHGFEIRLRELGAEDLPKWWPDGPNGRPVQAVRFQDRWGNISASTWAKYVQRFDNAAPRPIAPRHHQDNVEPQTLSERVAKPVRKTTAEVAAHTFEDAVEIAAGLFAAGSRERGNLMHDLRRKLSRVGIVDQDADDLLDLDPAEMVAEFEKRRRLVEESQDGTKTRR